MTPQEKAQLARIAAACRYDPLAWAEIAWPWGAPGTRFEREDIRVWQSEILDTIAQHLMNPETRYDVCHIAVASGHGIGKSALIGMVVLLLSDVLGRTAGGDGTAEVPVGVVLTVLGGIVFILIVRRVKVAAL